MIVDAARFQELLTAFNLTELFIELGWDYPENSVHSVAIKNESFVLNVIAQKRGVQVLCCAPDQYGQIPPHATQLKIEQAATALVYEHLLIFTDATQTALTWLWVVRAPNQPLITRTHTWHQGTSGEALRQKLDQIIWSLEDEEAITLTAVIAGLRRAFDREKVSKQFYEQFKKEHTLLSAAITGLSTIEQRDWYTSLMLNRLMFIYFIQRKGFLHSNPNYLSDHLHFVQQQPHQAGSFYRQFLRPLFHTGLNQPLTTRTNEQTTLLGEVPYLNGGLFDVHALEAAYLDLDIPNDAFEKILAFLDRYDWHLDSRPLASGNEINPDVLGYIFEKYINQKQMGAYYTKEDITEYIAKNTIIPHLLEQTRQGCQVAFSGTGSVWTLLQQNPDRYLYSAVKTGVIDAHGQPVSESALPDFVQIGMHDAAARKFDRRYNVGEALFNTATGERGTLPTETWREYIERRTRCLRIRDELALGKINTIDELITLNLDIRQLLQDVIDSCDSPDLLRSIWQAIVGSDARHYGIVILDPTCGSGAFLFSAVNILEPLYEVCLERMEAFVEDAQRIAKRNNGKFYADRYADFITVLDAVNRHPSRRYFIYKNIILNNLFGVDIMPEAVEICKLRLFLKLVSQVNRVGELQPLPDIDFNIRCGNTLVGYATASQFDTANDLASDCAHRTQIKAKITEVAALFDRFRVQQMERDGYVNTEDKHQLSVQLKTLRLELDRYLARQYGIDVNQVTDFEQWRSSHQPFHWFAEFYHVMQSGGFNVVIGNPPYIEMTKVKGYSLIGLKTQKTGNLYAPCVERNTFITLKKARFGVIVPLSGFSTSRMENYQNLVLSRYSFNAISFYSGDAHPSVLFDGVKYRLAIIISGSDSVGTYTSNYLRWYAEERPYLFEKLSYEKCVFDSGYLRFSKLGTNQLVGVLSKILTNKIKLQTYLKKTGKGHLIYHRSPVFWIRAMDFEPYFKSPVKERSTEHLKDLRCESSKISKVIGALINSSFFYFWFSVQGNCRNVTGNDISDMPIFSIETNCTDILIENFESLMKDYQKNSVRRVYEYKTGQVEYDEFYPRLSKSVIDKIDLELGKLFELNHEEIDCLINYDIKYRMGGTDDDG